MTQSQVVVCNLLDPALCQWALFLPRQITYQYSLVELILYTASVQYVHEQRSWTLPTSTRFSNQPPGTFVARRRVVKLIPEPITRSSPGAGWRCRYDRKISSCNVRVRVRCVGVGGHSVTSSGLIFPHFPIPHFLISVFVSFSFRFVSFALFLSLKRSYLLRLL